jgi:hypothetical protein
MAGKTRGPKEKPASERKDEHLTIWLTGDQLEAVRRVAELDMDKPSTWARKAILRAVEAAQQKESGKNGGRK